MGSKDTVSEFEGTFSGQAEDDQLVRDLPRSGLQRSGGYVDASAGSSYQKSPELDRHCFGSIGNNLLV